MEWIPISEELPNSNVEVLATMKMIDGLLWAIIKERIGNNSWDVINNNKVAIYPTHWMPVPPPPVKIIDSLTFKQTKQNEFRRSITIRKRWILRFSAPDGMVKACYAYIVPAQSFPAVTEIARKQFGDMVPYRAYWH